MPGDLDMTELMTDPDFLRPFTVRRARPTVFDDTGVASTSYETLSLRGIVQPFAGFTEVMLPEGTRIDNLISVWSKEELRIGDGKTREADVIVVDGKSYQAITCDPWPANGYFNVTAEGFVT